MNILKFSVILLSFVVLSTQARSYEIELRLADPRINLHALDKKLDGFVDAAQIIAFILDGRIKDGVDYDIVNIETFIDLIGTQPCERASQEAQFIFDEEKILPHGQYHKVAVKIKEWRSSVRGFFVYSGFLFFATTVWSVSLPGIPPELPMAGGLACSAAIVIFDMIPKAIEHFDGQVNPKQKYLLIPVFLTNHEQVFKAFVKISLPNILSRFRIDAPIIGV